MGALVKFEVSDVNRALSSLGELPEEMRKAVARAAIRRGARVLVNGMRRALRKHKRTGLLSNSIRTRIRYYNKRNTMVVLVGVASNVSGTFRGERITTHKYEHFVRGFRRSFVQKYRAWGRGPILTRTIGAHAPDDFVTSAATSGYTEVHSAIEAAVDAAIAKYNGG